MIMHVPVLLKEVTQYLRPSPGKKIIDTTVGGGGHTRMLLDAGAEVLGIDRDLGSIKKLLVGLKSQSTKVKVVQGNFSKLKEISLANEFSQVDGILFDLGMSSMQLDDPARGFAFQKEGPLDMRMNLDDTRTAADIVNHYPEKNLLTIFREYGEEKRSARKIARTIIEARKTSAIQTTTQLFELIKKALPAKFRFAAGDTARRIFQALRIEVNAELKNLTEALPQAVELLKIGGRLVVISFHSLEDRIVKKFFRDEAKDCVCPPEFPICQCLAHATLRILTKKPLTPQEEEIKSNPRARSAKLRAAEKIWEGTSH